MEELALDNPRTDEKPERSTLNPFAHELLGEPYEDEERKLNLNKLIHLAPYSEVLLVAGVKGVGKSVLLQQFVARAKSLWKVVHIAANSQMNSIDVSRSIVHGFGLPSAGVDEVADLLSDIGRYLQALGRGGRRAIIVVDNVHLLKDEVVRLLETILEDERSKNALSIVVSTEPESLDKFARFAILQEKLAYTLNLEPLAEEFVKSYILHRLAQARQTDSSVLFNDALVADIFQRSGGVPAKINELAHKRISNQKFGPKPGQSHKITVWAPLVIGVAIVSGILAFQEEINNLLQQPAATGSPAPEVAISSQSSEKQAPENKDAAVEPEPRPELDVAAETSTPLQDMPDSAAPAKMAQLPIEVSQPEPQAVSEGVEVNALEAFTMPEAQPIAESEALQEEPQQLQVVKVLPAAPVKVPEKEQPQPLVTKSEAPKESEVPQSWLRSQNPDAYTMQLMALRDEDKVRQFYDRFANSLKDNSEIFYIERKGRVLTAVAYGSYATRNEAVEAGKALPKSWGLGEPWVRSIASVQKDMVDK